ncbi:ABC-type branched-subunit amino acid transport system substrate-binding protein [Gillisia sp. Hel_I_86]|uniref:ABC transporter substrate-binding protein n=1 Tax=Gillisia sp. Hel_I_86 TaxID=1249981 RepID=UPI001198E347|nr:ABC transporter substrate-binding protein [Gillisia sp. Hel_I_86]TVZ28451.1 ABC-type branched-subunit amino acid transport system substrate-binding protein [Gillisia sp. Hel_I_86]
MIFKKAPVLLLLSFIAIFTSCNKTEINEINIGYIGPLSARATDLGIAPSKAMKLAVEKYNTSKTASQPKINLFLEDDKWEKTMALPAYEKLRKEHNIDIVFISNTDGTTEIQEKIMEDGVIAINPLNNDKLLSSLNKNTFKIAKSTEETHKTLGVRIIELGLKKVLILHFPNEFMTIGGNAMKDILTTNSVENKLIKVDKNQTDFTEILKNAKVDGTQAYVFLGYRDFGFAMKQARNLGIEAPFFGSTTLLDPVFFSNSEGAIIGTECTFFTPLDGNYILANEFLKNYKNKFGEEPFSIWAPMQAYDAMNIVINEVKTINDDKIENESLEDWLRNRLFKVRYYQGVCGNISITEDGSSRGIYFSLYKVESDGKLKKIKR